VVELTHEGAGGEAQVTPAQGSAAHAPATQPFAHAVLVGAYEQTPCEHVPSGEKLSSVIVSRHTAAGGALHATPAHGSPKQAPLAHPLAQAVVVAE
jgi:hypothetical protein